MSRPRDVMGLLVPMYGGDKDGYGTEVVPPLPLSFDRISEGRPPLTAARLFQLPTEILGLILGYIPEGSLPVLALVNRDCRQLARSRQFASVELDYSENTLSLIRCLVKEALERLDNGGKTRDPSLGACIRRITVATDRGWVSYRHGIQLDQEFKALPKPVRDQRLADAATAFFDIYIPSIQNILGVPFIMPHLELLDWEDKLVLPRTFFDSISNSTVQHLKLFRVAVEEAFTFGDLKAQHWPLRTLYLELQPSLYQMSKLNVSPTCASILLLCASTLESLFWTSDENGGQYTFSDVTGDGPIPQFARLRTLKLGQFHCMDRNMWNALVRDGLRVLKADTEADSSSVEFFETCGTTPSLDVFHWRGSRISAEHSLTFLQANTQLKQLSIESPAAPEFLNTRLLPLLAHSFFVLTSLSLRWDEKSIPLLALEKISCLKNLQQLHLSAGNQLGWKHDWLIDHNLMRLYFCQLPCLRKLAFDRDTYVIEPLGESGNEEKMYSQYYNFQICPAKYSDDTRSVDESRWEQIHRGRTLGEAHKYMRVMPNLEWLYFGQLPMQVQYSTIKKKKVVETLSNKRDECWTLLQEMFSGGAD